MPSLETARLGEPGVAVAVAPDDGVEAVAEAVPPVDGFGAAEAVGVGAGLSAGAFFSTVLPMPSLVIFGAAPSIPAVQ